MLLRFSGYVNCDHEDNRAATATTAVDGAAAGDETASADGATDWGTADLLLADWAAAADLADRAAVDQRGAEGRMPDLVGITEDPHPTRCTSLLSLCYSQTLGCTP